MDEQLILLIEEYKAVSSKLNELMHKLELAFFPIIDKTYQEKGKEEAMNIARQIPCNVIRAFAFDRIKNILPKNKS